MLCRFKVCTEILMCIPVSICSYRLEEMLSVCRDLLQREPSLVDIWLIVANLYAANGEVQATIQVGHVCVMIMTYFAIVRHTFCFH